MALSEVQNLSQNLDFRGHIWTFRAKNNAKSVTFKAKNNTQTTSEQLQNNFQKVQKTTFLTLKLVKMALLKDQKNLPQNFIFGSHISTFRAKINAKCGSFEAKNDA